jgi:two-component system, LuxR family, response regulator DctR
MTHTPAPPTNLAVYAVDDEPLIRRQYELLFQIVGIPCHTFVSGSDFLGYYKDHAGSMAGCILLDYQMPGLDGLTLFHRLRERGCLLPILMVTAAGTIPLAIEATKLGVFEFIEKPCDNLRLVERVKHAFATYRESRAEADQRQTLRERVEGLTPKEREAFDLLLLDLPTKVIAERMGISERTAEQHRQGVFRKLEAKSLLDLVQLAQRCGIPIPVDGK